MRAVRMAHNGLRVRDVYLQPDAKITLGDSVIEYQTGSEEVEIHLSKNQQFGHMLGSTAMRKLGDSVQSLTHGYNAWLGKRNGQNSSPMQFTLFSDTMVPLSSTVQPWQEPD